MVPGESSSMPPSLGLAENAPVTLLNQPPYQ